MADMMPRTQYNEPQLCLPLLWINHDANNRKSLPYRPAVSAHMPRYKRWLRQVDLQNLRESAKISRSSFIQVRDVAHNTHHARSHIRMGTELFGGSRPVDSAECPDAWVPEKALDDIFKAATAQTLTVLHKGNSDPFNALSVPIDARVASMIAYAIDVHLPVLSRQLHSRWWGVRFAAQDRAVEAQEMAEMVSFLHDECTAYSYLARIIAVLIKDFGRTDLVPESLFLRAKSMALLRTRLANPHVLADPRTSIYLLLFLTTEVYSGNFEAAACHAKMIAYLLQQGTIPVDNWYLFKAIRYDVERACFSLSRSAIDLEVWVPQQLAPLYLNLTAKMPKEVLHEAVGKRIDTSVTNPVMRSILTEVSHCSTVFALTLRDQAFATRETIFYLRCRVSVCMGRLVNHYVDSVTLLERNQRRNVHVLRAAKVEAYMSLALLFMIRCRTKIDTWPDNIDRVAIFSANREILGKLRCLLGRDEGNSERQYARIKLAALFVGAWAEQVRSSSISRPETEWFNVRLAAHAVRMGLQSWKDVREVLLSFHCNETMLPDGSTWFWKTMSASRAKPGGIEDVEEVLLK